MMRIFPRFYDNTDNLPGDMVGVGMFSYDYEPVYLLQMMHKCEPYFYFFCQTSNKL